ncbi:MAG: TonB family protein [Gammaproteobacteria bacterium]|nr:TonB family protein [Gammaproteobacteria bacterium]MCW5582965.1 TonB family protein [Gammaproteobacteria bacterium]
MTKKLLLNSFWISLLAHLLLLLSILVIMVFQPPRKEKKEKVPHYYVPSYTYTGSIKPSTIKQNTKNMQTVENTPSNIKNTNNNTKDIEQIQSVKHTENTLHVQKVQKFQKKNKLRRIQSIQPSLLAASFEMLRQEQLREVTKARERDPIYLIGDDNAPADPLIKLMGQSLSAHFRYPRIAGEFGIKGKVIIELTLHPEGYYSDVQMIKSSNNQDLDAAALYAVNSAPIVAGANRYIAKPRHFVIGFVFH